MITSNSIALLKTIFSKKAAAYFSVLVLILSFLIIGQQKSFAETVLNSPQNISVTMDNGNSKATVSWAAPSNTDDFTDVKYVITESPDGQSFTTESTSQIFENLSIGEHTFTVKAVGYENNGAPQTMIQNFGYTGSPQEFIAPYTGSYKLEVWGARGSNSNTNQGGNGGYSTGVLELNKNEKVFSYIGGKGNLNQNVSYYSAPGGYNGGGDANSVFDDYNFSAGSGGGATDFRLVGGLWNNIYSLNSRIIVAGGGGGASGYTSARYGGYGGGLTGGPGPGANWAGVTYGSTQTGPGEYALDGGRNFGEKGAFGVGGRNGSASGSGGGGWYGGTGGHHSGGAGGSGYVLTSTSYKPSGYTPTSSYWMTDAQTIAGNQSFPAPSGGTEVGHPGNGYAKITFQGVPLTESETISTTGELFSANLSINNITQDKENVEVSWSIDGNYTGVSYKITDDISQQTFTTPDTNYTFNNLSKGNHNFTVEAYNNSDQKIAEAFEEFSVKVSPTIENLTITQTQEDKALVKWFTIDNGGDEIIKTTLTVNSENSIDVDGNETQVVITLPLGINDLKIVSENSIGESNELTGSVDMKKTPSRVRNLQVIKKQNKVTVSWTPPVGYETNDTPQGFRGITSAFHTMDAEVPGDEEIEYLVESIPEGLSTTTTDNSVTFDLDEGDDTDYQFRVTPIMPFGSGEPNYTKPLSEGNNNGEVNVFIESSISLTIDDTDDSVSLKEIPGVDNVTDTDNQMTYSVRSNNLEGYNVTIQADQEKLLPSDTNTNLDSIPVNLLTIEQPDTDTNGTSAGIQTLSHTENKLLYSQNERSVEGGDSFTSLFSLTEVPFVNADDYSGTITYTATVN